MLRLRQVALVTADLHREAAKLRDVLGSAFDPYVDPGVGAFGLENLVFEAGVGFVEILAPVREATAGGRHLERHGGDAGYMAIFQVPDMAAARARIDELGIRTVWNGGFDDIEGTHLHPSDVGGAIVSVDHPRPPESWRWAGPRWTGGAPADASPGGLAGLVVAVADPAAVAARWAAVLGPGAEADADVVRLSAASQTIRFVPTDGVPVITEVHLRLPVPATEATIAGTRFVVIAGCLSPSGPG